MTYKQIEASREIRLWLKDVVVPTAVGVAIYMSNDDLRREVKAKFNTAKEFVKSKIINRA